MTDRTVDAVLDTNSETFEFDSSFEEFLNNINEADLYADVLSPSSLTDVISADFPIVFPQAPSATTVPPSLVPSSLAQPRSAHYAIGQVRPHVDRNVADVRNGVYWSGMEVGPELRNTTANGGSAHQLTTTPGTSFELQTYVDNNRAVDSNTVNFYRLEHSENQHGKTSGTLGSNNLQPHHPHHSSHVTKQRVEFQPSTTPAVHQRIQGCSLPRNVIHAPDRVTAAPGFPSDCPPRNIGSQLSSEQVAESILENLTSDNEELHKILREVVCSHSEQVQKILNSSPEGGQLQRAQHQQMSANTRTLNEVKATSCFPDTPPESGSEAHSPPNNLPPLVLDVSSNGDNCRGSLSKVSSAPGGQSTLPPSRSDYLATPGNIAACHHPVSIKSAPEQLVLTALDPQLLLNSSFMNHKHKKRKHSLSPQNSVGPSKMSALAINSISSNIPVKPVTIPANLPIKPEPVMVSDGSEDDTCFDNQLDAGSGSSQVIKWANHMTTEWSSLVDDSGHEFIVVSYRVDADKGFNFSTHDEAFVCQKKNHFQVTVHVVFSAFPKYIRSADSNVQNIDSFYLNFHGIKMESPNQQIRIEQSQSDRSKRPLQPIRVDFGSPPQLTTKAVIGRLHFSETTTNNMRKRGKPNPDQRYFQLVVSLVARCGSRDFLVAAQVSERLIVRASNPGQFDGDADSPWNKGKVNDSVFHMGNVGVNVENPDEALTVHGNIKLTGHVMAPSDVRAKTDLKQLDTSQQLKNISQINVYHYRLNEKFSKYAGLDSSGQADTGVLAQEVSEILPDAVQEVGDVVLPDGERIEKFLVVNKDRIFIEGIGAVKELCKVTDKLEDRINEIEVMNKRLKKNASGRQSVKSTQSARSNVSTCSGNSQSDNQQPVGTPVKLNSSTHLSTHHHQCRHHQHRQNSDEIAQKEEKGLCSNRVVQVIIVILVLIMALCMAAITTWVIIKDNLGSDESIIDNQSPAPGGGNDSGMANNTTEMPDWIATTETTYGTVDVDNRIFGGQPLLWPECLLDDCPVVECCLSESSATVGYSGSSDSSDPFASETAATPVDGQENVRSILSLLATPSAVYRDFSSAETSAKDAAETSTIQELITPHDITNKVRNITGSLSTSIDHKSSQSARTGVMPSPTETSKHLIYSVDLTDSQDPKSPFSSTSATIGQPDPLGPAGTSTTPRGQGGEVRQLFDRKYANISEKLTTSRSSSSSIKTLLSFGTSSGPGLSSRTATANKIELRSTQNSYSRYDSTDQTFSSVSQEFLDTDQDIHRKRRFVDLPLSLPLAEIIIRLGNETRNLTTDYCFNDYCRLQLGTRLSYQIPLGPTFPWLPVEIEFVFNGDNTSFLILCNSSFIWNCNSTESDEVVTAPEGTLNKWLLPVGKFLNSKYTFRIPAMEENIYDVCKEQFNGMATKFREYVITFTRNCSNQN